MTKAVFTVLAGSLLAYSSCCTKKKCGNRGTELTFNGFALREIDTIYEIVAGDTILYYPGIYKDSVYTYNLRHYGAEHSGGVTVWIPGAEKIYAFSNFRYEKEKCNECFPVGRDTYDAYKGCMMNEMNYDNSPIAVYK